MIYNKILRRYCSVWRYAKEKTRLQTGFTMLEAVVVVGVLLALAVGGLFAYGPIVANAKLAKLKSAASEVYTAATVYQIDGDPQTKPQDALDAFNASSDTIKVGFFDTNVVATPAMTTGESAPAQEEDFCIQARDVSKPELEAKSGNCPVPPASETKPSVNPSPATPSAETILILKNGDFSEGLKYWTPAASASVIDLPVSLNGEAVLSSGSTRPSTLSQTVSIPSDGITYLEYSYRLDSTSISNIANIRVNVYDTDGKILKEMQKIIIPSGPAVPVTLSTVDFTEFAGQNIRLEFHYTNGGYSTVRKMYLDNVTMENTKNAPSAPLGVKATVNVTDATISWDLPTSGSSSITSYTVTPYRNGSSLSKITTNGAPPATSAVFRGITSGADYTFTVTATNRLGESSPSVPTVNYSSPAETLKNGDFSAGLTSWIPTGGPVDKPTVANGEAVFQSGSTRVSALTQTITVPSAGITYLKYSYRLDSTSISNIANIRVNVYDTAGSFIKEVKKTSIPTISAIPSTLSTVDLTEFAGQDIKLEFNYTNGGYSTVRKMYLDNISIQTVNREPDAPIDVKITTADTDATVTWSAPAIGGSSVTGYTITPYRNGSPLADLTTTGEPPATSVVFKGMTSGGTYTFKVTATNKLGTSAQSASSDPFSKMTKSLENGDFSNGLTGWTPGGNPTDIPTVVNGEALFKSGSTRPSTLTQTVSIPESGTTRLKYSYRLDSTSISNIANIRVNVYDPAGKILKEMQKIIIPSSPAVPVTLSTVDLTEFAGQDIKVEFHYTNGGYSTIRNAYLDNVSIERN